MVTQPGFDVVRLWELASFLEAEANDRESTAYALGRLKDPPAAAGSVERVKRERDWLREAAVALRGFGRVLKREAGP